MKLFPAIDMYNGRCVRLYKGDFAQVTDYGDAIDVAFRWRDEGAEYLHIVDLNGAESGTRVNADRIAELVRRVGLPVQLGGGIRSRDDVARCLDLGVSRVILGTVCCDTAAVENIVAAFGADRVVCGIDCKDGMVAVRGWKEVTPVSGIELGKRMTDCGIETAVFTDIARDGALTGVNVSACVTFGKATGLRVIASGGVKGLDDLAALTREGVYGAILGKAIYEKKFTIKEAKQRVCLT